MKPITQILKAMGLTFMILIAPILLVVVTWNVMLLFMSSDSPTYTDEQHATMKQINKDCHADKTMRLVAYVNAKKYGQEDKAMYHLDAICDGKVKEYKKSL